LTNTSEVFYDTFGMPFKSYIGVIPEQSIVYSSEAQGSDYARINGTPWQPDTETDFSPNVTVFFPVSSIVNAILVQGGGQNGSYLHSFTVKIKNLDDEWDFILTIF
jgi:hypothetical protein